METLLNNPKLRENPFKVPQDYFEVRLPSELKRKIQASVRTTPCATARATGQKRNLWTLVRPVLQFAACFIVLFGFGYGILSLLPHTEQNDSEESASVYVWASPQFIYNLMQEPAHEDVDVSDAEDLLEYFSARGMSYDRLALADE